MGQLCFALKKSILVRKLISYLIFITIFSNLYPRGDDCFSGAMSILLVQGFPQRYILPFSRLTRILFAIRPAFKQRSAHETRRFPTSSTLSAVVERRLGKWERI